MENKSYPFNFIQQILIAGFILLFPLFFLPITREFLIYSKFYFLIFFVVLILFVSLSKFVLTKKLNWASNPAMQPFVLIIISYILSIVLASNNKMQAIFRPQFGLLMILGMVVFYLYASYFLRKAKYSAIYLLGGSALLTSLIAIVMQLNVFQKMNLPVYWTFLKNASFNTVGTAFDLLSFLVFALVGLAFFMWRMKKNHRQTDEYRQTMVMGSVGIGAIVVAMIFTFYTIIQSMITEGAQVILPPALLSWYAAVEVLKNPLNAVFGVGVDNFSVLFPRIRTVDYNVTSLWQVNTFATSRSTALHTLTELGLLGLTGFSLLIYYMYRNLGKAKIESAALFITSVILLILLPPSIMLFFMFFLAMAMVVADMREHHKFEEYEIDMNRLVPAYIAMAVVGFLFVGSSVYFVGRNFVAEVFFKRSIDAISENSLQNLYENQRRAVQYNPYNEEFRRNFSQTNLLVANNIAGKNPQEITDADRQTIAQTLQVSISEAKSAVALNPGRVTNWQNLATVYRQILNAVQQAPVWTIASYQQAILLDTYNPTLRLELGSVYYLLKQYDESQRLFEQAVQLKPDWANAHYNLAWSYYQKGMYQPAVEQMQIVLALLDPAKAEGDYKRAQQELETFKEKAAEAADETAGTDGAAEATKELNLPSQPTATVEPRLQLPEESSPQTTPQP